MRIICDLHIHSKYYSETSGIINLHQIARNCKIIGIDLIGTGDYLHPSWLNELEKTESLKHTNLNHQEENISTMGKDSNDI